MKKFDETRKYYTYVWFLKENNEVFYVGKGHGNRYRHKTRKQNPAFTEYVKSHDCDSRIVKDGMTEKEAFDHEVELIAHYRSLGFDLINIQDGGYLPPSTLGTKRSEATRKKMSESTKRYYEAHPEKREESSERMKAFLKSDESKEFREKSLKTRQTDEFRQAQSKRSREANGTEEYKARQSEIIKELWNSEEYAESHSGKNNSMARSVAQYDLNGNLIKEYETLTQASEETGCSVSKISAVARGTRKTTGGYVWKFSDGKAGVKMTSRVRGVSNEKCAIPIVQYTLDGQFVAEYKSTADAVKENGFKDRTNIIANLKGRTKSAYGYVWTYKHGNTVPSQQ